MGIGSAPRRGYAFGRFCLSADGTLLVRDGEPVPLAPKVLKTLLALVERAGEVVKKKDLLQAVWPDSFVEETGLTRNISLLRDALADETQTLIVTVARIGYRFSTPVTRIDEFDETGRAQARQPGAEPTGSRAQAVSRAVTRLLILPFRMLRDDPETGFLAFSVPDAMTHALSAVASLVVRSSAVAARFDREAPDLRRMAADADVDAVLTGTLMRSGERLRLTAQLSAVPCGTVLLSESLEVMTSDVFDLQDRLVEEILDSLQLAQTAGERRTLKRDAPASPAAYEYFLRANECVGPQGLASAANLRVARELYGRSIAEDRRFAPAWARLGRCLYLIGKTEEAQRDCIVQAEKCFQEALAISPDLPLAHNLYAWLEIDQGRAKSAMVRLISRALAGSAQPELFAALVQACRFCGLLEASVRAHDLARELDPTLATSAYQAWWQLGDDDRVLREGVRPWILEALIVGMRGDAPRAVDLLRAREALGLTGLARQLMEGLRAVFEGNANGANESASQIFEAFPDPEAVFYASRYVAFFGHHRALIELGRALDRGFVIYRALLRDDPWLDPLRQSSEFQHLLERAREAYREPSARLSRSQRRGSARFNSNARRARSAPDSEWALGTHLTATPAHMEYAVSTREFLITRRNVERSAFGKVLDALPAERWDYTPHERSPSARSIVSTMVAENRACCDLIRQGFVDWGHAPALADPDEIRRLHETSYEELTRLAVDVSNERWANRAQFRVGGTTRMEMPLEQLLWFFFFDAIHHRGQLSTYIRPMGGKVPAIYGPSADDPGHA